jgi:threonine dehydratase
MNHPPAAPAIGDVRAAAARIAGSIRRTPVLGSERIDRALGAEIRFKCDDLQETGAFKARGACNAVLALTAAEAARGVVTHSSGNHGAALAWAAARRGIRCIVVAPDDAPPIKIAAMRAYGAEVVLCPRAERDAVAAGVVQETGARLVHPFEDPLVMAGQGTAMLELLEDCPALDYVVAPVGGGGLLAASAVVAAALAPKLRVLGAEPALADDAARSLATGVRQPAVLPARSVCDGLLTRLGEPNFALLREHRIEILTVSDEAALAAAAIAIARLRVVVEPSSGTAFAVVREHRARFRGARVGVILTGGNTDLDWYAPPGEEG